VRGVFAREDFARCRPDGGNKATARQQPDDARVAICAAASTTPRGKTIFEDAPNHCGAIVSAGASGIGDMRQVHSFLRSASSRIGRRLAQIVAIAAASLPAAGV
jgi:hypothetical protein